HYRNLLGLIPGGDLQDEYVLIGAHYDHVGYGTPRNSNGPIGLIHNGADDNASGTAAVLEVIEAMANAQIQPRRSIIVALWDGEEKGLLGSEHWAEQPTIPLDQLKCVINMDMIGRLHSQQLEVSGTRSMAGLRRLVAEANYPGDLTLRFPWKVEENSDHHSFFRRSIPFLMFHTGLHDDYHRP
ncbi:MAG: M20/M25/M40 family metallo-hydrolase, partial [Planctomycetales bacterium]|nr:M20/M25/M40 family metallo-hydrolase [Planctomycetales bacterium]